MLYQDFDVAIEPSDLAARYRVRVAYRCRSSPDYQGHGVGVRLVVGTPQ